MTIVTLIVSLILVTLACSSDGNSRSELPMGEVTGTSDAAIQSCETLDPEGFYRGTIENEDGGRTTIGLMVRQQECRFKGLLHVDGPLYGSGPIVGDLSGGSISFASSATANETARKVVFSGSKTSEGWSGDFAFPSVTGTWTMTTGSAKEYFAQQFDSLALRYTGLDDPGDFERTRTLLFERLSDQSDRVLEEARVGIEPFGHDLSSGHPLCVFASMLSLDVADLNQADSRHRAGFFAYKVADHLTKLRSHADRNYRSIRNRMQDSQSLCVAAENEMRSAR